MRNICVVTCLMKSSVTISVSLSGLRQDSGGAGPKKFWMPWRMTKQQKSRETSLEKYNLSKNLNKNVGRHGWPMKKSSKNKTKQSKKQHGLKLPKAVPQKTKSEPKYK